MRAQSSAIRSSSAERPLLRSPKRRGKPEWYPYYAGYSEAFVDDALTALNPGDERLRLLDPWNGAGTTTAVGVRRKLEVVGFDLNPALTVTARARLLDQSVRSSLGPLAKDLVQHAGSASITERDVDLLDNFFDLAGARLIRTYVAAIRQVLETADDRGTLADDGNLDGLSSLASFFLLALFDAVRSFLRTTKTSNPTWTKLPVTPISGVTNGALAQQFHQSVARLASRLRASGPASTAPNVRTASALSMPIDSKSVDLVVSSPPYATRIDYAISTLPELAVLGITAAQLRELRGRLLGSPLTMGAGSPASPAWGPTAARFVDAVESHPSRASKTYYTTFFQRYFHGLSSSLVELKRVAKDDAAMVIVVQDSYYKEHRLDLVQICAEMAGLAGWVERRRVAFATWSLASIHPAAATYRAASPSTESAVFFSRRPLE